ncbi:transmembrane protein, putative [Bodo saltans]|uniref:Transmembrane protein, putative n=1 Tax=Bodo saltans TaxID=75058 RepID=A0A0S4J4U4_BODSA|nr:transmembrane protein, putative [Bodo saltans]|eukprot:CUG22280.1 transmembrane protein, putative [Bodo saltans]
MQEAELISHAQSDCVDVASSSSASKAPPTPTTVPPSMLLYQPTSLAASAPPPSYIPPTILPVGQPVGGISIHNTHSSVYQPPVLAQRWDRPPVGIPFPSKMIAGGDGAEKPDLVDESFNGINLLAAAVLLFFFVSALSAASSLEEDYNNGVEKPDRRGPYFLAVCGVMGLLGLVCAYRCKKFCCRVSRGRKIWSNETRLLTLLLPSKKTVMEWPGIAAGGGLVEVVTDPAVEWGCFGAEWVLIVLRPTQGCSTSNGEPVLLARCSREIVDMQTRAWTAYIDALRQPSGSPQRYLSSPSSEPRSAGEK